MSIDEALNKHLQHRRPVAAAACLHKYQRKVAEFELIPQGALGLPARLSMQVADMLSFCASLGRERILVTYIEDRWRAGNQNAIVIALD